MMSLRRTILYGVVTLACLWLILWFAISGNLFTPPRVIPGPGYAIRQALSEWLWSIRYLVAIVIAIVLYPRVIARPFTLSQDIYLTRYRRSQAELLAFLYYMVLAGIGSLLFIWIGSSISQNISNFHSTPGLVRNTLAMQRWGLLIGLLIVSAVNARFCWQFGYLFQKRDIETWIAFVALSALQMALLAWLDMTWWRNLVSSIELSVYQSFKGLFLTRWSTFQWLNLGWEFPSNWSIFEDLGWEFSPNVLWFPELRWPAWASTLKWADMVLFLLSLPITSLSLAWLNLENKMFRWPAVTITVLIALGLSVFLLLPVLAARLEWITFTGALALVMVTWLMGAVSSYRRGFLIHLYQRNRLRWRRIHLQNLLAAENFTEGKISLLRPLFLIFLVGVRISVQVANLLGRIIELIVNMALFAVFWFAELLFRIPELIGASIARVGRAAVFYVQYLGLPVLMYISVGVAIGAFATILPNYQALPLVSSGLLLILSIIVAVLGIGTGIASLFDLYPDRVLEKYLKWNESTIEKTPIGYVVFLLVGVWFIQSLGLLAGLLLGEHVPVWKELSAAFRPGLFYFIGTVFVVFGLCVLVIRFVRLRS